MTRNGWRPSTAEAKEFAQKMSGIEEFCAAHGIHQSRSGDSYYFELNGKKYRVSNHSVEASNKGAYDSSGHMTRRLYHPDGRESDVTYIHASKTRIEQIYIDLFNGVALDGRGNPLNKRLWRMEGAELPDNPIPWQLARPNMYADESENEFLISTLRLYPEDGLWILRRSDNGRIQGRFGTFDEAERYVRRSAMV